MKKRYTCPICGFEHLPNPPENHEICPCCDVEFGYDDANRTHVELREELITKGFILVGDRKILKPKWKPISKISKFKRIKAHGN